MSSKRKALRLTIIFAAFATFIVAINVIETLWASHKILTTLQERANANTKTSSIDELSCSRQVEDLAHVLVFARDAAAALTSSYDDQKHDSSNLRPDQSFIKPISDPLRGPGTAFAELWRADFRPFNIGSQFPHPEAWGSSPDRWDPAITIVFRGTLTREDMGVDIQQFFGLETDYYRWAARVVGEIKANNPNATIVTAGHSLGGSLAAYAALMNNVGAFTFNSAGLSGQSVLRILRDGNIDFTAVRSIHNFVATSGSRTDAVSNISLAGHTIMPGYKVLVPVKSDTTPINFFAYKALHEAERIETAVLDLLDSKQVSCGSVLGTATFVDGYTPP